MKTHTWDEVQEQHSKLSPEERAVIEAEVDAETERFDLPALHRAQHMTRATIADVLGLDAADAARIEREADAYIATLRRYVEELGGSLTIIARFGDRESIEVPALADISPPF